MSQDKLPAFRLPEADRASLNTLDDGLGFAKTDVVRRALRRLTKLGKLGLRTHAGPRGVSDAIEGPPEAPSRGEFFSNPKSIDEAKGYCCSLKALDRRTSSLSGLVMVT